MGFEPIPEVGPKPGRRRFRPRTIAHLMTLVALSGLGLAVLRPGPSAGPGPFPPMPAPRAMWLPPATAPVRAPLSIDEGIYAAAPRGIDDRMVVAAPRGIDDRMVVPAGAGVRPALKTFRVAPAAPTPWPSSPGR